MKHPMRGFTLVELLVTVALVAIVLGLAVPSFRALILNNRQATQLNELLASLNLARAEAVKRGVRAAMCKGSAATGCEATTAGCCDTGTTGWEQGWFVFADTNQDSNLSNAAGDALLQRHEGLPGNSTLIGNTNVVNRVIFNAQGASGSAGTLTLCDSRGATEARGLTIALSGRPRRTADTDSDGIEDDGAATPTALSCP